MINDGRVKFNSSQGVNFSVQAMKRKIIETFKSFDGTKTTDEI